MKKLRSSLGLNVLGLVLSGLGFALLIAAFPGSGRLISAALLGGGLLLIAASTLLLVVMLAGSQMTGGEPRSSMEEARLPGSITNRDQLATALQNLQDRTLDLIERRRWIHYLNTRQSNYVHPRETNEEIEATKRYREAKDHLEYQRLMSPTLCWDSIDSFKGAVERGILNEVYSAPSDREVYDSINQERLRTLVEINKIDAEGPCG